MAIDLSHETCQPDAKRLATTIAAELLDQIPGWVMEDNQIAKTFSFVNYHETMEFVNAVAWVAHRQDHHPDISFGYAQCRIRYSTHSCGGLSRNDFICAAKIDALLVL